MELIDGSQRLRLMPEKSRPITMAIVAMGGEGGGVLADWAVDLAEKQGYWAQATSVPGVAQRTGSTIYYLEFMENDGSGREPILSTMPTPGEVDIVLASELMEAGRAVFRGLVTPEATTLITSTNRMYSMQEKTAMGDGRISSEEILESCEAASRRFIGEDFAKIAEESGTVISASLFGALASSGALPWSKEDFIAAVERSGVGVAASLKAFERSFEIAKAPKRTKTAPVSIEIGKRPEEPRPSGLSPQEELALISDPASGVGPALQDLAQRIKSEFPEPVRVMLIHGIKRCTEYQDVKYASQYLDRLVRIKDQDEKFGDGRYQLLTEVARYTALWMTYEDTIRVADLKARRRRFDRVKKEAKVNENQITQVREFFHPGVEEITDTLPGPLGRAILKSQFATKIIERVTKDGLRLHTTSLHGYILLYTLSRLRPLRRRSLRFSLEQNRIDAWLDQIFETVSENYSLAVEIAETANVIKGYGDTHRNGLNNFNAIMREVNLLRAKKDPDAASQVANLRKAALADESGTKLRSLLSTSA
jgi:indolepyruvate ferredoxin oxidoreductase beta subunit